MDDSAILMTDGDYRKKIIAFAIPLFIGNLFQQLYNTADSLIVGNFLGSEALAAVSSVGSLVYLFIGFFMGFATGAGVIVSRHIGAKDDKNASIAVHNAIILGIILSIIMTIVGYVCAPLFLRWMKTPDNVFSMAKTYLQIYFAGFSGMIMYNIFTGILQATGDAKHPLYYLIFSSLVNIVLDTFLIAVVGMGVDGAALATIFSQFLSAIFAGYRLFKVPGPTQIHLDRLKLDTSCLKEIIYYGLPTALQGCVIDISNILIQSYINSFGSAAMAGIGAAGKSEGFLFLPVTTFSMAMTTFVSQNIGAKEYDRARKGIRFGYLVSLTLIESLGILFFVFAPWIISLFNQDPAVIAYGVDRARICSFFFILVGYSHISSAVCRGLGKPAAPMVIMLACWCAVRVGVLFTIGMVYHNILLAYVIYPITWALSSIVFFFYIRKVEHEVLPQA